MFNFKTSEDEESTEDNVIEFELKVKCTRNPHASKEATDPDDLYINHKGANILACVLLLIYTGPTFISFLLSHNKTYEVDSSWKPS